MFSWINVPARIVSFLVMNITPAEVAGGVCLGLFLGFIPLNGPLAALLFLFFFLFKINRVSTAIVLPFFKLAYLLGAAGLAERLGGYLLIDARPLAGFWSALTSLPVLALLDLNNTQVMGGLALAVLLCLPLYVIARWVFITFIEKNIQKIQQSDLALRIVGHRLAGFFIKKEAPQPVSFLKYLNIRNLVVLMASLLILNVAVGLAVSPLAGALVVRQMNKAAGTRISVGRVHVWPLTLSFTVRDLKVFDPQKTDTRLVSVGSLSARMSVPGLLAGRMVWASVRMDGVRISIEGEADGSFNIERLSRPQGAGKAGTGSFFQMFQKNQDWFGRAYTMVRERFSKDALARQKEKKLTSRQVTAEVTPLPQGRRVHFRKGEGMYLVEVRSAAVTDLAVHMKARDGREIDIVKAVMEAGDMAFDPQLGARFGRFHITGALARQGVPSGSLAFNFKGSTFDVQLKDVDLDAVRFIYEGSLPVEVVKGTLNLDSKTDLTGGALDSRNALSLTQHAFRSAGSAALICQALNGVDPVHLEFHITGTVDKPEFGGFMKSLMQTVTSGLKNPLDLMKTGDGASAAAGFLKKLISK